MTPLAAAALLATVLATSFVSGLFSLGGGVLLMGVMGWLLPVSTAMVLHGVAQMASNGARALLYRAHIQWRILGGYYLGTALCVALFAWIAFVPEKELLFLVLGLLPFVNFAFPKGLSLDITRRGQPTACGFLVTACQLSAGVSGTILDLFYVKAPLTRYQIHGTKGFTQMNGHLVKVAYFTTVMSLAGNGGWAPPLWLVGAVIPVAYLGNRLARPFVARMSDRQFRVIAQGIVMSIGVIFLIRAAVLFWGGE